MSGITAPVLKPPSFVVTNDFPDWLSPILVKELRQGLKTRMFIGVFLAIQAVMIVLIGFQLIATSPRPNPAEFAGFNVFFWLVISIPLMFLMPARGLSTVSGEQKANTLELVQLTRLGSFRTVLGKWVALSSQSVLLVVSVLPYAVLRYFFGTVNIVEDLFQLGHSLLTSVVLTALAIALSSMSLVVRILFLIGLVLIWLVVIPYLFIRVRFGSFFGGGGPIFSGVEEVSLGWIVAEVIYLIFFLEIAAARIAPVAENHAVVKRFGALFCVALSAIAAFWGGVHWLALAATLIPMWIWIILEALNESTSALPKTYMPFVRWGILGRLLARVFSPGWASGILFTALFLGACLSMLWLAALQYPEIVHSDGVSVVTWMVVLLYALITPVLLLQVFPRLRNRVWLYLLFQLLFILLFVMVQIVSADSGNPERVLAWLAPFPTSFFMALCGGRGESKLIAAYGSWTFDISAIVISLLLLWRMRREFRLMAELERSLLVA